MYIRDLHLSHYRNYGEQSVTLGEGINVFLGENAQGKTNALEAIYFLAMGKSHRTNRDAECIMKDEERAMIEATVVVRGRDQHLRIELQKSAKRASINGMNQAKMTEFVGQFQVVLFAPEDLQLVKGSPGVRRRFLDMEMGQTQAKYLFHLSQYQRIMQHRNTILKNGNVDWDYLEVFDEQLIQHGAQILTRRMRFVEEMNQLSANTYESISSARENLTIRYASSIPEIENCADISDLEDKFRLVLQNKRSADQHFGHTHVGPHRDDVLMFLDNQPVHAFASQGQQRSIALSLRLAEIEFIHKEVGEYPVLLLDDVLSELDDHRQKNLVLAMSEKVQTIITGTSLFQLNDKLHKETRVFHVSSGILHSKG